MHNRHIRSRFSRSIGVAIIACAGLVASLMPGTPASAQGAAEFVFQGGGWGHGVGMSQNGARNMANGGTGHVGILNHYYPNTVVSTTEPLGNIRVHLGDASRVELSSAGSIVFDRGGVAINAIPSGSISVSAHDGGLQIGNAWTTGSATDPVYVSFPMPVTIANNGHRYLWGKLQLTNRDGQVRVVEDLPLEQYVAGVSEMPAAWPLEALMAQAIAARTYAHEVTLHRRNSAEWAQEYDISGTTVDQNYIGWDAQDGHWDQKWLAAVSATAGVEIVDSSGPVRAYYSASNGGYTETAAYVFGNDVPYTVSGPDPFDAGGHDWTSWTRTYSQESISRWLNASADTSVGTLHSIEVLGGSGASARIDKAVVELVGSGGSKRVTGKRLMLVINAGVFGEGGGLGQHLPGTFTTVGNGGSAGPPQPGGAQVPATVTPDPLPEGADENEGYVPPAGWEPEPGTGVAPGAGVPPSDDGNGDPTGDVGDEDYVPPEGWEPEPGTGVAPGTGVPPGEPRPPVSDGSSDPTDGAGDTGFVPPPDWEPEPGTGVAPGSGVPAGEPRPPVSDGGGDPIDGAEDTGFVPPPDWEPEPGSGVAPGTGVPPGEPRPPTTGAATSAFVPPVGWEPEAGTGVPPGQSTAPTVDGQTTGTVAMSAANSLASTVLLVSGSSDEVDRDVTFEVISPTDELAGEARARLQTLQTNAAVGLFADIDVDGYIAAVAPRPVHGVCMATDTVVTCVPLSALEALRGDG